MANPGESSRRLLAAAWLVVGLIMVLVPVWLGWTRWEPILAGHPLVLVLAIGCGLAGFVALAWSVASLVLADRSESETRPRTPRQRRRRDSRRLAFGIPALFLCALLAGALAWSRPFPATAAGLAAMRSGADVRVADRLTWYELVPAAKNDDGAVIKPTTGLVFVPGARVDPRAYARILRPLAQAGYLVTVVKDPFGVAFVDANHPRRVIAAHPEISRWVVAGHSLGGVTAASFAQSHPTVGSAPVAGLVLWASYPASRVDRSGLTVTSISGERDGLSTPAEVQASKADLPPTARFVVVPGAVHSWFGDYGLQPGDGSPSGDRAQGQAEITDATRAVLAAVTPKPKKKQ